MYTEFKEYVAYCQNDIKVLSGLKFYAHLNWFTCFKCMLLLTGACYR